MLTDLEKYETVMGLIGVSVKRIEVSPLLRNLAYSAKIVGGAILVVNQTIDEAYEDNGPFDFPGLVFSATDHTLLGGYTPSSVGVNLGQFRTKDNEFFDVTACGWQLMKSVQNSGSHGDAVLWPAKLHDFLPEWYRNVTFVLEQAQPPLAEAPQLSIDVLIGSSMLAGLAVRSCPCWVHSSKRQLGAVDHAESHASDFAKNVFVAAGVGLARTYESMHAGLGRNARCMVINRATFAEIINVAIAAKEAA